MEIYKGLEEDKLSRRRFLAKAGVLTAGATTMAVLSGCGVQSSQVPTAETSAKAKPEYPWGYKKIDPDRAAEIAYDRWYKGFCSYSVVSGILVPLQEEMGEPYALLPLEAFKFAHGGVVGWGTMCGTLIAAGIATSFIAGEEGEKILNDVINWYTTTELPIYKPANPKADIKNVNKSGSPLCHISVGKWMKKEGVPIGSPQRKDRCARLSVDVTVKTVNLLNEWTDGKFVPVHGSQVKTHDITSQNNCTSCHGTDVPMPPR
ncbi:MAG: C_GCAxxG_C_C family protein [Actinobacteria bacterium]|nr:C_GCAxxG_C_C family protein [Actinomycetota bacterium]